MSDYIIEKASLLSRANMFAEAAHVGQTRKGALVEDGPEAPYISHLLIVAGLVQNVGAPDHVIAASVLHDVIEDTPVTYAQLRTKFGPVVADLVLECSEAGKGGPGPKAPWRERKETAVKCIGTISPGALIITAADRLQSLQELWRKVRRHRDRAFAKLGEGETLAEKKASFLRFQCAILEAAQARLAVIQREQLVNEITLVGIEALLIDFEEAIRLFAEENSN